MAGTLWMLSVYSGSNILPESWSLILWPSTEKNVQFFFLQAWKNGKCWCLLQGFVFIFCYDYHRATMRICYHYQQSNDFWSADSCLSTAWTWSIVYYAVWNVITRPPIPTLILSYLPSRRCKLIYSNTFSQILKHWDFFEVVIENAIRHVFLLFMDIINVIFFINKLVSKVREMLQILLPYLYILINVKFTLNSKEKLKKYNVIIENVD